MEMTRPYRHTLCFLMLAGLMLAGEQDGLAQWYYDEIAALRARNIALSGTVDSLRRELLKYKDTEVIDLWAGLEGIEEDGPSAGDLHELTDGNEDGSLSIEDRQTAAKVRLAAPFLIIPYGDDIRRYIDFYGVSKRRSMPTILKRYHRHEAMFRKYFSKYGIPDDIMALAIVESAVSSSAVSKVGAVGMWQFMSATAEDYGLEVNALVDERKDAEKATDAAARYLRDAKRRLGSWQLAVLSYNCGVERIRKAIIKNGGKTGYRDICGSLPAETQGYLLSLIAVRYVMAYPEEFGL